MRWQTVQIDPEHIIAHTSVANHQPPAFEGGIVTEQFLASHSLGLVDIPIGMHQQTRAGAAIAATAADLLIEAIQRLRQSGVQHCTNIVFVDAESEGGSCNHAIHFIGRPGT